MVPRLHASLVSLLMRPRSLLVAAPVRPPQVLGTARNAGLVLFSSFWYHEHISELEALGYAVSLLAFGAYNYLKIRGL